MAGGGGASAKKASRRKDFIDSAAKITAHKRHLDDPGASDPDIMNVFQDLFSSTSKLMHGIAFDYSTGVSHEVVAHNSAFAHRLAEYIGQEKLFVDTCDSWVAGAPVRLVQPCKRGQM